MQIEILVIGNELLNGDLADTNTARLATVLRTHGLACHRGQTVPDTPEAIVAALRLAASRSQLVLVSGGLGPTEDDLTLAAAATFAGVPLVQDDAVLARLKQRFERRGYPFTPNNARQAQVPAGADVLDNPVGTAPCVRLVAHGATCFFFPGVPIELARLVDDYLVPWLAEHAGARPYVSCIFKTFGTTESQVAAKLADITRDPRLHVAYRAHFPEIRVSLHVQEADVTAANALLSTVSSQVRAALGPLVYADDADTTFVGAIANPLLAAGETLATAESCTGGLISAMCTDLPGSSGWFLEGAATYSNAAKMARLGVPAALIEAHGAVSEPVARAMAEGIRDTTGATWGLGITGIAGPGGGTADKPVGTVHYAVAGPAGVETRHKMRRLPFDRARNRTVSAWMTLDLLRYALSQRALVPGS